MKIKNLKLNTLRTIPFSDLSNWSVQYILNHEHSYNTTLRLVRIGDFLRRSKIPVIIEDNIIYRRVTIKTNNGGVFLRDIVPGYKIGTKKQFQIKEAQFLLSKIDARNGAFGVVPKELHDAVITGNFWAFDVDINIVNPHFLALITTTASFMKFSQNASNGTTNRHYLQEGLFLDQKVPLPTLVDQDRIVSEYYDNIKQAENNVDKAKNLENDIEKIFAAKLRLDPPKKKFDTSSKLQFIQSKNIERWGVDGLSKFKKTEFIYNGKYEVVLLRNLIENYQYGLSSKASNENIGVPILRMNNINNSELNLNNLKYVTEDLVPTNFILELNDILFNRTNSKELVGKTAIFDLKGTYTFASYLIRIKVDATKANPSYINFLLNSEILQIQKDLVSRQITGQANINAQEMQEFLLPIPPLRVQQQIAEEIKVIKQKIYHLLKDAEFKRFSAINNFEKEIFS